MIKPSVCNICRWEHRLPQPCRSLSHAFERNLPLYPSKLRLSWQCFFKQLWALLLVTSPTFITASETLTKRLETLAQDSVHILRRRGWTHFQKQENWWLLCLSTGQLMGGRDGPECAETDLDCGLVQFTPAERRGDKKLLNVIRGKKNPYFPYGSFSHVSLMKTEIERDF